MTPSPTASRCVADGRANSVRYDSVIRVVMWLDGFLSVGIVVVGTLAAPLVATLGVPAPWMLAVGVLAIVTAVLLAAFGAVTAVLLMLRMRAGQYHLPQRLRLPLPNGMRPDTDLW